jgi:mycofactocin system glycosyltransferase
VLKLNSAAVRAVERWRAGGPVTGTAELALARRLHDAGIAVLRVPTTELLPSDVTVIVPVRDRADELDRCLAGLGPCAGVIVVDDASRDPCLVAAVAHRHGAEVVRRDNNGGPAAARNTGLALVRTPLVAFVDCDVELSAGWLDGLLPSLLDERIAVVGPRVVGSGGPGLLARYETRSGPLDLGAVAGPVRPGARVGHLPAAVLLCRTACLAGGFDEQLRVAEDVDLLWRLAEQGYGVRYEPRVVVGHRTRATFGAWLKQRYDYGRSAAELDLRHPGAVAPAVVNRWTAPAVIALALRRPGLAAAFTAMAAVALHKRLPDGRGRAQESARLAGAGLAWTLVGLAEAGARTWLPALAPAALVSRRVRRLTAAAVAVRLVRGWRAGRPDLDLLHWSGLRVTEDLAYGTGVWRGAVVVRRPGPVLPWIN